MIWLREGTLNFDRKKIYIFIFIVCMLSCFSHVWLCGTPRTVACQAPLFMGFSRREYWSRLPCPSARDLPNSGIEPASLTSPALAGGFFTTSTTWETPLFSLTSDKINMFDYGCKQPKVVLLAGSCHRYLKNIIYIYHCHSSCKICCYIFLNVLIMKGICYCIINVFLKIL